MEQNNSNIIRGYSKAIFAVANEFDSREQFLSLLEFFSKVIKDSRVTKLLNNSALSIDNKVDFLLILTNGAIIVPPLAVNLIKLLAKNKHLLLIPKIYEWYDQLYLQHENKLRVEIISAFSLNEAQKNKLYQDLIKYFNKDIFLEYKIDPSIIAGIIIKYADEVMDYSFKKKLLSLEHELLE